MKQTSRFCWTTAFTLLFAQISGQMTDTQYLYLDFFVPLYPALLCEYFVEVHFAVWEFFCHGSLSSVFVSIHPLAVVATLESGFGVDIFTRVFSRKHRRVPCSGPGSASHAPRRSGADPLSHELHRHPKRRYGGGVAFAISTAVVDIPQLGVLVCKSEKAVFLCRVCLLRRFEPWHFGSLGHKDVLSYENSLVFHIMGLSLLWSSVVFCRGPPYRKNMFTSSRNISIVHVTRALRFLLLTIFVGLF